MKLWPFLLALALVMGGAKASKTEYLYAATDSGTIYQYQITKSGALQPLTPPSVSVADAPVELVLHPSGRFAYAVTVHWFDTGRHDPAQVIVFRINPNGTLTRLEGESRTCAAPADNVTMDPKGRFLFVSGEDGHLFTFRIRHDGTLMPLPDNMVVGTFHIDTQGEGGGETTGVYSQDAISLDPAGRFLYLFANTGFVDHREFSFVPYRLDSQGTLHALAPEADEPGGNSSPFSTPRGGLFVTRRFSGKQDGTYRFRIGPHGLLVPMSPPVLPNQYALLTTNSAEGKMLWTEADGGDYRKTNLASYRVDPGGRLTLKAAHAATVPSVYQVAASRKGRFFYVADYNDGTPRAVDSSSLLAFAITPQGTLKALATKPPLLDSPCLSLVVGESR